jgi:threonyl-tRNA synthetase
MIHRALLGSMERFFGVLIEHYGGAFPLWLAPVQAIIVPVSEKHQEYAEGIEEQLLQKGLRAEADLRNEKVGYKIRDAQLKKIPYMLIVGDREVEAQAVSVRNRFEGEMGTMSVIDFVRDIKILVDKKAVKP